MPVFYKFSRDGSKVYIAKTIFSKSILEEEYFDRAKQISVDDFLSKFDEKIKNKLKEEITYLSELNDKLIKVSKKCHKESIGNHRVTFKINDEVFHYQSHLNDVQDRVGKYVKEMYGDEFYTEWYNDFVLKNSEEKESAYIKTKDGIKQLTENQINQLEKTIKLLTKINSVDNLLSKRR